MAFRKNDKRNFPASAESANLLSTNIPQDSNAACRRSFDKARRVPAPSPDARTSAAFCSLLVHTKELKTRSRNEFPCRAAPDLQSRDNKKSHPAKSGPCNKVHGPTAASSASSD